MTIQWPKLEQTPRLLMQADLTPAQGRRFQPTGFPNLGAAVYDAPDRDGSRRRMALVESAASVANRLEAVCWDDAADAPHSVLTGMPYVSVTLRDSGDTTNSMLEAHRLNSAYIMLDNDFKERLRREANLPTETIPGRFDMAALARTVFRYDPGSVLHGVFLVNVSGVARLQRSLAGYIEATDVETADSGGVKNDRLAPSPKALKEIGLNVSAEHGFGNVPFHRVEYTARTITAYFSLDLAQIRAYRLGEAAERFLVTLGLWKTRRFLDVGLRLRTACDLIVAEDLAAQRPAGFAIPPAAELEAELPGLIRDCAGAGLFAEPAVTRLAFPRG